MSFDLYFLARAPGQNWEDAVAALEELPEVPLTKEDVLLWDRLESEIRQILPAVEPFEGERNRELTHDETGIQISFFHGELSLSVPYWQSGPESEALITRLRQLVTVIERVTGLTAYDPQAEAPFLGEGDQVASRSFDVADRALLEQAGAERSGATPKPWWRKLLGK